MFRGLSAVLNNHDIAAGGKGNSVFFAPLLRLKRGE
jgi:hypothetical protein